MTNGQEEIVSPAAEKGEIKHSRTLTKAIYIVAMSFAAVCDGGYSIVLLRFQTEHEGGIGYPDSCPQYVSAKILPFFFLSQSLSFYSFYTRYMLE